MKVLIRDSMVESRWKKERVNGKDRESEKEIFSHSILFVYVNFIILFSSFIRLIVFSISDHQIFCVLTIDLEMIYFFLSLERLNERNLTHTHAHSQFSSQLTYSSTCDF